ncbi:alkaline phosphatase family protein, partial [Nocardia sp. NPDC004722]
MGVFDGLDRRAFLAKAIAAGGVGAIASWASPIIDRAYAADPAGMGGLGDIEHFVLLMQENRSFDHYFGTYSGARGFGDPSPAWQQYGYAPGIGPTSDGFLLPFRLDTTRGPSLDGECINDPDHSWAGMLSGCRHARMRTDNAPPPTTTAMPNRWQWITR